MTCDMMESLGPFLLGAVETEEWSRIDRHLGQCEMCRAEVVRLAGLPGLIGRAPTTPPKISHGPLPSDSIRTAPRRARRGTTRLVAACAAVMAIAGFTIGMALTQTGGSSSWSHQIALAGANPIVQVHGGASLTARRWGTEIWVQLDGVRPGTQCRLLVNAANGRSVTTGAWSADANSTDWMPASAPFTPAQITSIDVSTPAGELVRLTRRPSTTPGPA